MSTIFGWVARFVFLAGIVLAITSALIGVRERRDEIGLLAALGLQAGVTTLLLFESVIICGLSFILGSIVAMIVLAGVLPQAQWLTVMGPSLVMGSTYLIVLLVLTPLVAAQQVAARSAAELVREGTST
jgi:ABC-type antimicrobial peptide transport system permease subunit